MNSCGYQLCIRQYLEKKKKREKLTAGVCFFRCILHRRFFWNIINPILYFMFNNRFKRVWQNNLNSRSNNSAQVSATTQIHLVVLMLWWTRSAGVKQTVGHDRPVSEHSSVATNQSERPCWPLSTTPWSRSVSSVATFRVSSLSHLQMNSSTI